MAKDLDHIFDGCTLDANGEVPRILVIIFGNAFTLYVKRFYDLDVKFDFLSGSSMKQMRCKETSSLFQFVSVSGTSTIN
jgi:hypothetical protein